MPAQGAASVTIGSGSPSTAPTQPAAKRGEDVAAHEAFLRPVEQGPAAAQYSLGYMFERGQGVEQNHAEAVRWYRKAAEQGHAAAQYSLGYMIERGQGVEQNHAEAVKWFRKAAEQGHAAAQYGVGYMFEYGQGVEQNHAEAVKWFRKAAEQGLAEAQLALGIIYESGAGVPRDLSRAHEWYSDAAKNLSPGQSRDLVIASRDRVAKQLAPDRLAVAQTKTAPTAVTLSNGTVAEHAAAGTAVGRVGASDPDAGERFTYSLTEDAGGRFAIDPETGLITVADGARLDFEAAAGHQVTVRVADSGGLTHDAALAIAVVDVNEAPRVKPDSFVVDEDAAAGTAVGRVGASDPDAGANGTLRYAITGGDAGGRFAIDAETGTITVADGARLDFEAGPSFELTVSATDRGGLGASAAVTVKLNDSNEAPSDIAMTGDTVAEHAAAGTAVGRVGASDPDAGER
ncbi:MAG: cadherin domain-containing protein, partial [Alphaproteobacteria bacterium]